jgi:PelA/Pel-15E family pectate lyase
MKRYINIAIILLVMLVNIPSRAQGELSWKQCRSQKAGWYGTGEAVRVADNLLYYQRSNGGWPKNTDFAAPLNEQKQKDLQRRKNQTDTTIDNGATYTPMRYLAKVYVATNEPRFKVGFIRGLDFLLEAQYDNGGWPQYYPIKKGYSRHITFNDDAMIGTMRLLREIAQKQKPYQFVEDPRRRNAAQALEKGIECILKCQIVVKGKKTAWCAQHDEKTFMPRPARTYEKVSLSGSESVGIIDFLMEIEKPTPEIIESVQAAVAWLHEVKLTGIRQIQKPAPGTPKGYDKVIIKDPTAPPLWGRFCEIGTNRPIFCSRDGVIRYQLSEISYERRNGYSWYTGRPRDLLAERYPVWQKKYASPDNGIK